MNCLYLAKLFFCDKRLYLTNSGNILYPPSGMFFIIITRQGNFVNSIGSYIMIFGWNSIHFMSHT